MRAVVSRVACMRLLGRGAGYLKGDPPYRFKFIRSYFLRHKLRRCRYLSNRRSRFGAEHAPARFNTRPGEAESPIPEDFHLACLIAVAVQLRVEQDRLVREIMKPPH